MIRYVGHSFAQALIGSVIVNAFDAVTARIANRKHS